MQNIHRLLMPTRVHNAQAPKIQPHRQGLEPGDEVLMPRRILADLPQERLVLLSIALLTVRPQKPIRSERIPCHPRNRIELMVTEDAPRGSRLYHGPHELHRLDLLRPTINKIANKYSRADRMPPDACG